MIELRDMAKDRYDRAVVRERLGDHAGTLEDIRLAIERGAEPDWEQDAHEMLARCREALED